MLAQPVANRVIGEITASMPDAPANRAGVTGLGDVIADAQLNANSAANVDRAVASFIHLGGIRTTGFSFVSGAANGGDGKVTYREAFMVQPFGDSLVTLTLNGEQIHILLEERFIGYNSTHLQVGYLRRILLVNRLITSCK